MWSTYRQCWGRCWHFGSIIYRANWFRIKILLHMQIDMISLFTVKSDSFSLFCLTDTLLFNKCRVTTTWLSGFVYESGTCILKHASSIFQSNLSLLKADMLFYSAFLPFHRDVFFEFHLKFWNTASIDIPARSLL